MMPSVELGLSLAAIAVWYFATVRVLPKLSLRPAHAVVFLGLFWVTIVALFVRSLADIGILPIDIRYLEGGLLRMAYVIVGIAVALAALFGKYPDDGGDNDSSN